MQTPKVYLIDRKISPEQLEHVQQALNLTPLVAIVVTDLRDMELAKQICPVVSDLNRPIAILADFSAPISAVQDDGKVCPLH